LRPGDNALLFERIEIGGALDHFADEQFGHPLDADAQSTGEGLQDQPREVWVGRVDQVSRRVGAGVAPTLERDELPEVEIVPVDEDRSGGDLGRLLTFMGCPLEA
jgi:hypothetical protein